MSNHLEIARLITNARRQQGFTQSEIAKQVGCRQSAVSMYERGHANALAREKVESIIALLAIESAVDGDACQPEAGYKPAGCYCPVFDCPSNVPIVVQGRLLIIPHATLNGRARHCSFCGELLERACPECGASVNSGACCIQCGAPYISTPPETPETPSPVDWADSQRTRLHQLGLLH